ncbi:hypothetical protein MK079_02600 [Candidatus Gracilibacteria bacterium]|nr:hypothetical protein [Candidatus Gracilibacteria bacterium]
MSVKKTFAQIPLKTSLFLESLFAGDYKTHFAGKGMEFEKFVPYEFGKSAKNIDFSRSSNLFTPLEKVYTEERQLDVYLMLDMNMSEKKGFLYEQKNNLIFSLIDILGRSIFASHNRMGGYIFENKVYFSPKKTLTSLECFMEVLALTPSGRGEYKIPLNPPLLKGEEIEKKIITRPYHTLKLRKKMIFYITSSCECMDRIKELSYENDVRVIHVFHHFENTLEGSGIFPLGKKEKILYIDLNDHKKKEQYKKLRQEKIHSFKKQVMSLGLKYIYLDTQSDMYQTLFESSSQS